MLWGKAHIFIKPEGVVMNNTMIKPTLLILILLLMMNIWSDTKSEPAQEISLYKNSSLFSRFFKPIKLATVDEISKDLFANEGYDFIDWNTKSDGSGLTLSESKDEIFSSDNVKLYAQWVGGKIIFIVLKFNLFFILSIIIIATLRILTLSINVSWKLYRDGLDDYDRGKYELNDAPWHRKLGRNLFTHHTDSNLKLRLRRGSSELRKAKKDISKIEILKKFLLAVEVIVILFTLEVLPISALYNYLSFIILPILIFVYFIFNIKNRDKYNKYYNNIINHYPYHYRYSDDPTDYTILRPILDLREHGFKTFKERFQENCRLKGDIKIFILRIIQIGILALIFIFSANLIFNIISIAYNIF